jgi:hypothetical protein
MNSKHVLGKIMAMLSLTDSKVLEFTDAKLSDGTILQSPTFDVGESVEVVSEDGTKSPAPNGEHEIALTDAEGKEILIKILVAEGKITERENVELPEAEAEKIEEEMQDEMPADVAMAKDYVEAPKGITSEVAKALPNTTDEDPRNSLGEDTDEEKDPIISLTYRITELEKALTLIHTKLAETKDEEIKADDTKEEEIKVPKLDGAPIDETMSRVNLSGIHKPTTNKVGNSQNSFLSKLYN